MLNVRPAEREYCLLSLLFKRDNQIVLFLSRFADLDFLLEMALTEALFYKNKKENVLFTIFGGPRELIFLSLLPVPFLTLLSELDLGISFSDNCIIQKTKICVVITNVQILIYYSSN